MYLFKKKDFVQLSVYPKYQRGLFVFSYNIYLRKNKWVASLCYVR